MCRKGTLIAGVAACGLALAQAPAPDWRKLGGTAIHLALASPAGGPVDAVWFAGNGERLYARTLSGSVLETQDFETWSPAVATPPAIELAAAERLPEPGARLVASASGVFALGGQVYRSSDGGRSWDNLTAWGRASVIGAGQRAVAVSPLDPSHLVVANDFGVWRSFDGGLSWSGLNSSLPNLAARRILSTPGPQSRLRLAIDGVGSAELGAEGGWVPVRDASFDADLRVRARLSSVLNATVNAVATSGDTVYAGAADGRIWVSFDGGRTWPSVWRATGAVERLYIDTAQPRVALAALSGGGPRILRTTNSGVYWDDLTSNLPEGAARGITADRAAGAIYAATERGVFFARADLENAGPVAVNWLPLTSSLPPAPAADVRLDANGHQLYIALEGYGVYAAAAPHRARVFRLVNAADFSTRPAAPGSLVSVLGGRVNSVRSGELSFPVLAASEAESQIQVPFEARGANLALALETGIGRLSLGLPLEPVSPAIFVDREGVPMLLEADSGLMLDAGHAARSNARIQILATGMGRVRPEWPTGMPAPLEGPPAVIAPVRAYLDRTPVEVTRATLAPGYVGFYLIELQLPAIVNAGPAELFVAAEGRESNRVRIYLEP